MEDKFNELMRKALNREITPEEEAELHLLLQESVERQKEYALLRDIDTLFNIREGVAEEELQRIKGELLRKMGRSNEGRADFGSNSMLERSGIPTGARPVMKTPVRKWNTGWVRYAAVLIPFVAVLSVTAWYFVGKKEVMPDSLALMRAVQPGTVKAYLSVGKDTVALSGNHLSATEVPEVIARKETESRVLTVPRGAEYKMTLEDGTQVWLGSDSRLVYPARFNGGERMVELTGEAFFEVTPNKKIPFVVRTKDVSTKVLGTSFSLSAYPDKASVKSILVTGAVQMTRGEKTAFLEPGRGADFNLESGTVKVEMVNVRKATAMKEGRFFFDDEPLSDIFRELSRWYNVEIKVSEASVAQMKFYGVIRKDRSFSEIMEMMRQTHKLDFKMEGNRIEVMKRMN